MAPLLFIILSKKNKENYFSKSELRNLEANQFRMTTVKELHSLLFKFSQQGQVELNGKCKPNCLVTFTKKVDRKRIFARREKGVARHNFFPKKEMSWKMKKIWMSYQQSNFWFPCSPVSLLSKTRC